MRLFNAWGSLKCLVKQSKLPQAKYCFADEAQYRVLQNAILGTMKY